MSIQRPRSALIVGLAGGALVLFLAGCSANSATSDPRSGPARPPTTTPAGAPSGPGLVQLTDYSDNDGARSTVVLTGAIGDYGHATTVHGNGSTDPEHGDQLALQLARGSFRLRIADLDKEIVTAFADFPPNRVTCSGRVSASGPAAVVTGSGSGDYRGISGSLNLSVTIDEVDRRAGCGPGSTFLSQAVVIIGSGTVRL